MGSIKWSSDPEQAIRLERIWTASDNYLLAICKVGVRYKCVRRKGKTRLVGNTKKVSIYTIVAKVGQVGQL
jgi:hypothetical protein